MLLVLFCVAVGDPRTRHCGCWNIQDDFAHNNGMLDISRNGMDLLNFGHVSPLGDHSIPIVLL